MANSEELRSMVFSFRVSELQDLLGFAGRNKTGKKQELQARAVDLLKLRSAPLQLKVLELHKRRFHVMNMTPGGTATPQPDRPIKLQVPAPMTPRVGTSSHSMGSRANVMASGLGYGSSVNYPNVPTKNAMPMAPTPQVSNSHYPIHPDTKLKPLPFYDVIATLLQPSSLSPTGTTSFQENMFQFTLAPPQVNQITMSKDSSSTEYGIQIQMRFCLLENSCEQADNFPPSICVKVNNRVCSLPNPIPTNRPGVEPKRPSRPVNITSLCKLSPVATNVVNVSWASEYGRGYVVSIYLVRRLDSAALLSRLKGKGVRSADLTRTMIQEKLEQSPDSEISTTSLRGSLICPIGKMKMQLPCRSIICTHLQCFDASLFIKMNEKKPRWICPVCDKPSPFQSLTIDGLFSEIASKAPLNCTEVQFHADGSWTPIIHEKEAHDVDGTFVVRGPVKKHAKKKREVEVIDLTIDSDTEETWYPSEAMPPEARNKKSAVTSFQGASTSSQTLTFPTSKVPTTAAFITLPSPSSPSVISPYDGHSSSGTSVTTSSLSKSPLPLYSIAVEPSASSINNGLLTSRESGQTRGSSNVYTRSSYLAGNYFPTTTLNHRQTRNTLDYIPDVSADFDLYSLLQTADPNQRAPLSNPSGTRKNTATPDVISLD